MKKKEILPSDKLRSFDNYLWFVGYAPSEVKFLIKKNNLTCMLFMDKTPIQHTVWFHIKDKIYA